MTLDLNTTYTTRDVAALLASKDDSQGRSLRVDTNGIAYLSDDLGAANTQGVALRFETWDAGMGYVGPAAAQDPEWVARIEKALRANWPNPKSSYLDSF